MSAVQIDLTITGDPRVNQALGVLEVAVGTAPYDEPARPEPAAYEDLGVRLLAGGMSHEAGVRLDEALALGADTDRLHLHRLLAVVAGRQIDHVTLDDTELLRERLRTSAATPDAFSDARAAAQSLVLAIVAAQSSPSPAHARALAAHVDDLSSLPAAQAALIRRHLGAAIDAALVAVGRPTQSSDGAAGAGADPAVRGTDAGPSARFAGDRARRASLFFVPDAPRATPLPLTRATVSAQGIVAGLVGGFALAAALITALSRPSMAPVAGALLLLAVCAGHVLWAVSVGDHAASIAIIELERRRFVDSPPQPDELSDEEAYAPHYEPHDLPTYTNKLFDAVFAARAPGGAMQSLAFLERTSAIRKHLAYEIMVAYGEQVRRSPEQLMWLALFHARGLRDLWDRRVLTPTEMASPPVLLGRTLMASRILIGIGWLGVCGTASSGSADGSAALVGLVIIAVACLEWFGNTVLAVLRRDALLREMADRRAADEGAFLDSVRAVLDRDRPDDGEIAAWVEADLRYLGREMLAGDGGDPRLVSARLSMLGYAPGAMRAHVRNGPVRYSRYRVEMLALTENGVRRYGATVDVRTGQIMDLVRGGFGYHSLASVQVVERGVVFHGAEEPTIIELLPAAGAEVELLPLDERVRFQTLCLRLGGSEVVHVLISSLDPANKIPDLPARSTEERRGLEASGVRAAFPLLERAAAEGARWIPACRAQFHQSAPRVLAV